MGLRKYSISNDASHRNGSSDPIPSLLRTHNPNQVEPSLDAAPHVSQDESRSFHPFRPLGQQHGLRDPGAKVAGSHSVREPKRRRHRPCRRRGRKGYARIGWRSMYSVA
eukprot:scaffold2114_cov253-Pinguiococcus_pyrenoidosus.AAC.10